MFAVAALLGCVGAGVGVGAGLDVGGNDGVVERRGVVGARDGRSAFVAVVFVEGWDGGGSWVRFGVGRAVGWWAAVGGGRGSRGGSLGRSLGVGWRRVV